jgi:hypothetical protein
MELDAQLCCGSGEGCRLTQHDSVSLGAGMAPRQTCHGCYCGGKMAACDHDWKSRVNKGKAAVGLDCAF